MQTTELPTILDYPWTAFAGPLAIATAGLLMVALGVIRLGDHPVRLATAAAMFVGCLWTGAYFATWNARIDSRGMTVSAPFAVSHTRSAVAWRDTLGVSIGGRVSSYGLRLLSVDGSLTEIALADLPQLAVVPFAAAVSQQTQHVAGRQRMWAYNILAHRAVRAPRGMATFRVTRPSLPVAAGQTATAAAN